MQTIQTLAAEAYSYFTQITRDGGKTVWAKKNDTPDWVDELCFAAHNNGGMFPDDWIYEFIVESLSRISDGSEDGMEPDIYTGELCEWLASHCNRVGFVDEAVEKCGSVSSIIEMIQLGQYREKREVMGMVLTFLEERLEELEEAEELDKWLEELDEAGAQVEEEQSAGENPFEFDDPAVNPMA